MQFTVLSATTTSPPILSSCHKKPSSVPLRLCSGCSCCSDLPGEPLNILHDEGSNLAPCGRPSPSLPSSPPQKSVAISFFFFCISLNCNTVTQVCLLLLWLVLLSLLLITLPSPTPLEMCSDPGLRTWPSSRSTIFPQVHFLILMTHTFVNPDSYTQLST